jgi:chaperonin cofactor prefoldin
MAIADTLRRSAALGLNKLPTATTEIKNTDTQTPPQKAIGRVLSKWEINSTTVERRTVSKSAGCANESVADGLAAAK